jgi:hypothetical protein
MSPTRRRTRSIPAVFASASALVVGLAFASACGDSNGVTSPTTTTVTTSAANVAGAWSGSYTAYDPAKCTSSAASATFSQNGTTVTGILRTSQCGVAGSFKGTVNGDTLMGAIDMTGCVGGAVTGTLSGSELRLSLGDMTKPLITGDTVIMAGGSVTLRR